MKYVFEKKIFVTCFLHFNYWNNQKKSKYKRVRKAEM